MQDSGRQTPTQDRGNRFGQGLLERSHLRMRPLPSTAALPPPPPITAPLTTRLINGAERSLAGPAPRGEHIAWLPTEAFIGSPRAWWKEYGKRRRENASLPDPPSPTPPAFPEAPSPGPPQRPAAQPPPSPPPTHVRAASSALRPPPAPFYRSAAEPHHPIGPATGGEGVLPLLEAQPGVWSTTGIRACVESTLGDGGNAELRQWLGLDR